MVVMTSMAPSRLHRENPYHDRIEGNVLVYTGAGREGDQELAGSNRRLFQQINHRFPIYLFALFTSRRDKTVGARRWRFLGLLEYLRHYQESQVDIRNVTRSVWLFELLIHKQPSSIVVKYDENISLEICSSLDPGDVEAQADRQVADTSALERRSASVPSPAEVSSIRTRLLSLDPQTFEHLIEMVLLNTGFERVTRTRYSQDGGVDVNAYHNAKFWPIRDILVQVQAKRWLHTVGRREVAELRGSLEPHARGVVVTTSHFSRAAINEASAPGRIPIGLVDGNQFSEIILSIGPDFLDRLVRISAPCVK
jgi:HJR/Mrr/RecB family endonuclease